jgi:hypothetical protein
MGKNRHPPSDFWKSLSNCFILIYYTKATYKVIDPGWLPVRPRRTFLFRASQYVRPFLLNSGGFNIFTSCSHAVRSRVPQRREIKNLAEETSRKKGRKDQKENFAFPSKLLDGPADQEAKPLRRSTYCLAAETRDRGVLKQTATAKVTTAPNAIRQGNSIRGSQAGAQRA